MKPYIAVLLEWYKKDGQKYAAPSSMIKTSAMLLEHIGYTDKTKLVDMALRLASQYEKK